MKVRIEVSIGKTEQLAFIEWVNVLEEALIDTQHLKRFRDVTSKLPKDLRTKLSRSLDIEGQMGLSPRVEVPLLEHEVGPEFPDRITIMTSFLKPKN